MIHDDMYTLIIGRPSSGKGWALYLSLTKTPMFTLASSEAKFKTLKDARVAADKNWPTLYWVNNKKAYLKSLEG